MKLLFTMPANKVALEEHEVGHMFLGGMPDGETDHPNRR